MIKKDDKNQEVVSERKSHPNYYKLYKITFLFISFLCAP